MISFLNALLILGFILLSVAFFTLFERKLLSLSQLRVGPNKLGVMGVFQPLLDALKLLLKDYPSILMTKKMSLYFFPSCMFTIMVLLWGVLPSHFSFMSVYFDFIFFLSFLGCTLFFILLIAFFSTSKYAYLGSVRSAGQSISYEISLNFISLSPTILSSCLNMNTFYFGGPSLSIFVFLIWWVSCLMECNRAPFDFAEGESELISGFNIEYSSVGFTFIFLSEYGMLLYLSLLSSILFLNSLIGFFLLFLSFISIRASFPRFRYDKMMKSCWEVILPLSIFFMFIFVFV